MDEQTIDTSLAKRLAEAGGVYGAAIVGKPGGWSVVLKLGVHEKVLGAQRTDKPRIWRSLDRCIDYLRSELSIVRVDSLDASQYCAEGNGVTSREDTAERMRRTHEAAAHDKWFRTQVEQAIVEADDPSTAWVSHEDAKASWAKKRAEMLKYLDGSAG